MTSLRISLNGFLRSSMRLLRWPLRLVVFAVLIYWPGRWAFLELPFLPFKPVCSYRTPEWPRQRFVELPGRLSDGFIWAAMSHAVTYDFPMAQNDGKLSVPPYLWLSFLSEGTVERFSRHGRHDRHWISESAMNELYWRLRLEGILKEADLHASLLPDPAAGKGFPSKECKLMRALAIEDGQFAALYEVLR